MKINRLKSISSYFVLIALLSVAVFAQRPSASTPSVNRLQQIIAYLASDALEGRRTGTPGANDAAHYVAGEFSLLGLRPGLQIARPARNRGEMRARYLQPFPYVASVELGKNNLIALDPERGPDDLKGFTVGKDWLPLGFSSNGGAQGAATVFAGYGISSAELKYDDYAVSNVNDRLAIVL